MEPNEDGTPTTVRVRPNAEYHNDHEEAEYGHAEAGGIAVDIVGNPGPAELIDAVMEQKERVEQARAEFAAQDFGDFTKEAIARMKAKSDAEITKGLAPFWDAIREGINQTVDSQQRAVNAARFPLRAAGDANTKTRGSVEYGIGVTQGQAPNLRHVAEAIFNGLAEGAIDRASAIIATANTVQRTNVTPEAQAAYQKAVDEYNKRTGVADVLSRLEIAEQSKASLLAAEKVICTGGGDSMTLIQLGLIQKKAAEHPYFRHEHTPHVGISKQRTR
jgi:hypothetical protein